MTEPDYRVRNANASVRLDDAKEQLGQALHDDAVKPATKIHLLRALRHLNEALSFLRGD